MNRPHILVVDDEPDIRNLLKEFLADEGYEVSLAANVAEARIARRDQALDLILLDIWMPDGDGISLLKEWAGAGGLDPPVIMISGHGSVETAVEATRLGAYDFIEKPLSYAKLKVTMQRALETASLRRENIALRRQTVVSEPLGDSRAIAQLKTSLQRLAQHKTTVFMTGESGSGKEVFARYLHAHSPRAEAPFVAFNIAAVAAEALEEELFGGEHDGQIFAGAFERANGGTLFLKDVADLKPPLQARLLDVLEKQSLLRANGREPVKLDVRLVAASRRDLKEAVAQGRFRDDLYYHLNVVPAAVPPLREHSEDVPPLLLHYLEAAVAQEGLSPRRFSASAMQRLRNYEWPGNVRELRNLVQRLLILGHGEIIETREVDRALGLQTTATPEATATNYDIPYRQAREEFERAYLEYQLQLEQGNVSRVAEKIGLERTHLHRKLKTLGIDPKASKASHQDDRVT
ncbi:MAG TPA: sigma-54 dependent transcriptional regulator [Gammaproteobacteria bacterium]|nr:sigma-54 dependent transcriptional regulator [Gammaproteobacteria bacterium]